MTTQALENDSGMRERGDLLGVIGVLNSLGCLQEDGAEGEWRIDLARFEASLPTGEQPIVKWRMPKVDWEALESNSETMNALGVAVELIGGKQGQFRIELHDLPDEMEASRYLQSIGMATSLNLGSVYMHHELKFRPFVWQWPLKVGFFDDDASASLYDDLRSVTEGDFGTRCSRSSRQTGTTRQTRRGEAREHIFWFAVEAGVGNLTIMTMHTRRPLERIVRIHDQIRRGGFPNCNSMAGTLEVTPKTVQRDVSFMKDGMGLPLEYDGQKHGYYYTKPVGDFPLLEATAEDLVSLFVARTALGALEGTPLEATLKQNLRRLAAMLGGTVTLSWSNLERAVSSKRTGTLRKRELSRFETVARALLESRELKFEYRKLAAGTDGWETRKIRPYHLAEVDNGWYIIGHDTDRNACRTFALQRMRSVTLSKDNRFRVPDDFDPAKHFGGSLGIWPHSESTAGRYQVKIRFTGWAARFVPERQWHPSQDFFYEDPGGETSLIAFFTLDTLEEMIRWVLGWGKHAEVLEPPELIEAVKSHLSEALGKYS